MPHSVVEHRGLHLWCQQTLSTHLTMQKFKNAEKSYWTSVINLKCRLAYAKCKITVHAIAKKIMMHTQVAPSSEHKYNL